MKNTLDFVLKRFNVDDSAEVVVELDHGRDELVRLFKDLDFKSGAEIGVARGKFSAMVCEVNSDLKLYSIDPWMIYDGYDETHSKSEHRFNYNYRRTRKLLAPFKNCKIIKKLSMDAIKDFDFESLDFVYIDANHDPNYVAEDIEGWSKIVRKGGIVSGHDYRSESGALPEVSSVIDLHVKNNGIKKLFRFAKDNDSSWFFVKGI